MGILPETDDALILNDINDTLPWVSFYIGAAKKGWEHTHAYSTAQT